MTATGKGLEVFFKQKILICKGTFNVHQIYNFFYGTTAPDEPGPSHCRDFTITLRHTTLGRTPLDE